MGSKPSPRPPLLSCPLLPPGLLPSASHLLVLQAEGRMWHLGKSGEARLQWGARVDLCVPAQGWEGALGLRAQPSLPPTLPPTHPQISSYRRPGHLQRESERLRLHLPILSQSRGTGPQGVGRSPVDPILGTGFIQPFKWVPPPPPPSASDLAEKPGVIPVIGQSELPGLP